MNKLVKKWSLFSATALAIACAVCSMTTVSSQPVEALGVTASYTNDTVSSANLQSLNIDGFTSLDDFTNYFALTYDDVTYPKNETAIAIGDVASYDETNASVKISNNTQQYLGIQFHPDGTIGADNYYGKTSLGNFEVKINLKGIDVGSSENIYFGSRIYSLHGENIAEHESDDIAANVKLQARLTGSSSGQWTLAKHDGTMSTVSGTNKYFSKEKVDSGITLTVGYVNNYCYMYADTTAGEKDGGYIIAKTDDLAENAVSKLNGNQAFAMYFTGSSTYAPEIEISSFSYKRLDTAYDAYASDETSMNVIKKQLGLDNVEAEWADGYTEDASNKSQYLQSLNINGFESVNDFTDWFKLDSSSSSKVEGTDYTQTVENGALTLSATSGTGFRLLPFNTTGNAYLGNFEVKIKVKTYQSHNVYFGSRISTDSNSLQNEGLKAILNGGTTLTSWHNTAIQSGANSTSVTEATITLGFIDNACYFYVGDEPNGVLSDVSIYTRTYAGNATNTRNAWQAFGIYLYAGAKVEISSFSYRRLTEYPYNAPTATVDESVESVYEYLDTQRAMQEATFADGATAANSSTVQSVDMPQMESLHSFTEYFKQGYVVSGESSAVYIWGTLDYNATNKSVKLGVPSDGTTNTMRTQWRFMPQETYGRSYLGNYEMSLTFKVDATKISTDKNIYFGNYQKWDNESYYVASTNQLYLSGGTVNGKAAWTINGSQSNVIDVEEYLKVTIGYVNGFYYWYLGEPTGAYTLGYKDITQNSDNTARDGNQVFAITMTEGMEIELCSFSYERLSSDTYAVVNTFSYDRTDTADVEDDEELFIKERAEEQKRLYETGVLDSQEYEMIEGASVRLSDPSGLRFAATFKEEYINFWEEERGYTVELGVLIAPSVYITEENGALTFENTNYTLNKEYIQIVCEDKESGLKYSIINGLARVNGVLKVKTANYTVAFTGVAYLHIKDADGNIVYTKYAAIHDNVRSMKDVVDAALADETANYTDTEIEYLQALKAAGEGTTTDTESAGEAT
ncbi:MAG: hypothetical protein IJ329_03585 [Clostridia bacterium]|nr:hypothetical protein [Clostridia bacterium]